MTKQSCIQQERKYGLKTAPTKMDHVKRDKHSASLPIQFACNTATVSALVPASARNDPGAPVALRIDNF